MATPGDAPDCRELTVHHKRDLYVLEDSVANRRLRGTTALLSEAEDGTLTIRANGRLLASQLFPKDHARLAPGDVVDHERLDGVFAWIAAQQNSSHAMCCGRRSRRSDCAAWPTAACS